MYRAQQPSAFVVASTKLQNDWSAHRCVQHISCEWIDALLSDAKFPSMSSMAKIRLLLAGLLAVDNAQSASSQTSTEDQSSDLRRSLHRLRDAVAADADDWDKVMAAAAGPMDGRLDLDTVMKQSPVVQESIANLQQEAARSDNQALLPPMEADFLSDPPSLLKPDTGHFVVRPTPAVKPLSEEFSYLKATPPPPALLRTKAALHQPSKAATAETSQALQGGQSAQQQGTSGMQQREQRDRQASQQQLRTQYLKRQQQQQQQEAPKGRRFNIYGIQSAAEKPAAPAAAASAATATLKRQQPKVKDLDAVVDDLFDDKGFIDDTDYDMANAAPSGVSIAGRHFLQHKYEPGAADSQEAARDATPDELLDEMAADGWDVEHQQRQQQQGAMEELDEQQQQQQQASVGQQQAAVRLSGAARSAGKRRLMQVVASDDEDDD